MTGKLSLKELELERRHWAGTDWAWMVTEQRRRFSAWMSLTGALTQGPKDLTLRWKEAFTQEQRLGADRLLESLSEVTSQVTSEIPREDRAASERLGGVCCPRSARQHSKVAHGDDAEARLKLMGRSILKALPGYDHLASREEIVEFRCHHLHTATSWIAATNWKVEASESDRVAEDWAIQRVVPQPAGFWPMAIGEGDRHLRKCDCWSQPWSRDVGEECAYLVGSEPSLDELESKLSDLGWLVRDHEELGCSGASQH